MRDYNGDDLTYWPISNLIEGDDSEILIFVLDTPIVGFLTADSDPRIKVWARENGVGSYQDITNDPIDLSGFSGPTTEFQCYVESIDAQITGFEFVPLVVSASQTSPAGWSD